jgi:hypothetical protein
MHNVNDKRLRTKIRSFIHGRVEGRYESIVIHVVLDRMGRTPCSDNCAENIHLDLLYNLTAKVVDEIPAFVAQA